MKQNKLALGESALLLVILMGWHFTTDKRVAAMKGSGFIRFRYVRKWAFVSKKACFSADAQNESMHNMCLQDSHICK